MAMTESTAKKHNSLPTVRFANMIEVEESYPEDIIILPTYAPWNDFGYRIRAEVGFPNSEGTREWLSAFIAIKGQNSLATFIKARLTEPNMSLTAAELAIPFASLFIESKSYSLLSRTIGLQEARRCLLAINDASVLHSEDEGIPDWPEFFTSEVFTHAMTRSSEGYFSFRHGARVLAGLQTSAGDARRAISVDLAGNGPRVHFDFDFDADNLLRGRIAVIIGKNGCGKTSSLARLAKGFATDKPPGINFLARPEVNQVLVFAHSGAIRLFKQRRDRPGAASVRTFALDPATANRKVAKDKPTQLLVDIARTEDFHFRPLEILKRLVKSEFPDLTMYIPIRGDEIAQQQIDFVDSKGFLYAELSSWPKGSEGKRLTSVGNVNHNRDILFMDIEKKPRALSLGQSVFFNFALNALANAGPSSVLLIDEPENFLHPNLISRFMRVLHQVANGTNSIAIIATHSPFVVREVQSAQVHVLRQITHEGYVEVAHPRLQTLGANVASIANEVFSDDLPQHLYTLMLNEAQLQTMTFETLLERYAGELSAEALMYLRRRSTQDSTGATQ